MFDVCRDVAEDVMKACWIFGKEVWCTTVRCYAKFVDRRNLR